MKKMRRLIPAIAMLLVSAVMLSTASFAWFTMSTTADVEGMSVKATADSTLLIAKENNLNAFTAAGGSVTFANDGAKSLKPATHYVEATHGTIATESGLVTVSDASTVTPSTGAYSGAYKAAANAGTDLYYVDYTVYLAASGTEAMKNKDLNAVISINADLVYLLHNAVSIDFIVNGDFDETVNLKTVDASVNPAANQLKINLLSNTTITPALGTDTAGQPTFTDTNTIKITMRVYFDGALVQAEEVKNADGEVTTPTTYYVRNALAVTNAIAFGVQFQVVDYVAPQG